MCQNFDSGLDIHRLFFYGNIGMICLYIYRESRQSRDDGRVMMYWIITVHLDWINLRPMSCLILPVSGWAWYWSVHSCCAVCMSLCPWACLCVCVCAQHYVTWSVAVWWSWVTCPFVSVSTSESAELLSFYFDFWPSLDTWNFRHTSAISCCYIP